MSHRLDRTRTKVAIVGVGVACAVGFVASEDQKTLDIRLFGLDGVDGVWLGSLHDDTVNAEWTFSTSGNFRVTAPVSNPVTLLAVAKDRLPETVRLVPETVPSSLDIHLSRGLALDGAIRSEDGVALGGARITVAPVEIEGLEVPSFARPSWSTSDGGTVRIGGLTIGCYVVEATAEGHVPVVLEDVPLIRDGRMGRLELKLPKAFFVEGEVVDNDGFRVAGLEVGARWLARKRVAVRTQNVVRAELSGEVLHRHATVRTDQDGSYRHGPFEAATKIGVFASSQELGSTKRREVSAPFDNLVLRLSRELVRGVVLDAATGLPVESFEVRSFGGSWGQYPIRDADGRFDVVVHADTHTVMVDAPGFFPWFVRLFTATSGEGEYDLGEITLEHERTLKGRILDAASGAPIVGAIIRRSSRQYDDPYLRMLMINWFGNRYAVRTDEEGAYAIGKLPAHADQLEVAIVGRGIRHVRVPAFVTNFDMEITFDLVVSGSLTLPDGTPAEGLVRLVGSDYTREREVTADGSFRWEGLGPGKYLLEADSPAGRVQSRTITIREREFAKDIQLVVDPGRRIAGAITGLVGPEQVVLSVLGENGRTLISRRFGNGAYSMRGLPAKARIIARTTTNRALARRVRFGSHAEARLDFDFRSASRLTGRATTGGGPVRGLGLQIVPENREFPRAYATTTDAGHYDVQGLSDGPHIVRTRTGYSFDVNVAGRTAFDIRLPSIALMGSVQAERTGKSVGGGWALLERVDTPDESRPVVLRSRIASDGTFVFDGLVSGTYIVRVSHPNFEDVSERVRIEGVELIELFFPCEQGQCGGES